VCEANAKATVGVTLASLLSACSDPYQGYRLTLRRNGGAPVVVKDTAGTASAVQYNGTLSLGTGVYTLEAELGTGNYRCPKRLTFEVKSLQLTLSVSATPASCREGARATAVISGATGPVNYRWFRLSGSTVRDALPTAGAQVNGLTAGSYRLEISTSGNPTPSRAGSRTSMRRAPTRAKI
jgi:hypothetical protein